MRGETQWLDTLANAGFLYGPFFFALLFMLVITRFAHSYYQKANRADPPATPEEKSDYRLFFRASWICGIVLVFIAIAWWVFAQLQRHSYQGVIMGIDPKFTITATDDQVFLRAVDRDGKLRDYHFAVVRDRPFAPGEQFRLGLFDAPGAVGATAPAPISLVVTYTGSGAPGRFYLSKDASSGYKLEKGY